MMLIKNSIKPIYETSKWLKKSIFPIKPYSFAEVESMVTIKQKAERIMDKVTKRSAFRMGLSTRFFTIRFRVINIKRNKAVNMINNILSVIFPYPFHPFTIYEFAGWVSLYPTPRRFFLLAKA